MSIFWANERPSSSDSEDSEPENIEWPKNNYTLSHITIAHIIIILAATGFCLLHRREEITKEPNSCPSNFGEFESENGQFEREQKSFMDLLQSCEDQVNTFQAENIQLKSEKQKYKEDFQEKQKELIKASERFNALHREFIL